MEKKTLGQEWHEEVEKESPAKAFLVFAACMLAVILLLFVTPPAYAQELTAAQTPAVENAPQTLVRLQHVKETNRYLRAYDKYRTKMTRDQRHAYGELVKKLPFTIKEQKARKIMAKLDKLVARGKLCSYVNAKDFDDHKVAEVSKWGPRINAYLKGSPMAGTGYIIAKVAYDHNCDPRLYPAIACIESGKGVAPYWSRYNVCGWIFNPPAMHSWEDACRKWHVFFGKYFAGDFYPINSAHGYGGPGYGPGLWNAEMRKI